MINSAARLFAVLTFTFVLLTTLWANAAETARGCRKVGASIVMCDGAGWQLPEAPRGTVRSRSAYSAAHRAAVLYNRLRSERVGTTVVVARLGARVGG